MKNKELLLKKNQTWVGVDYDLPYIEKAKSLTKFHNLETRLHPLCCSIYDVPSIRKGLKECSEKHVSSALSGEKTRFNCVYFSGSITLLPDPLGALKLVAEEFINKRGVDGKSGSRRGRSSGDRYGETSNSTTNRGNRSDTTPTNGNEKIYITQTFQISKSPITEIIKPLLKTLIRIDFGVVTYESDLLQILDDFCKWSEKRGDVWKVERNEVVPGPGNTPWQKSRLVVLGRV